MRFFPSNINNSLLAVFLLLVLLASRVSAKIRHGGDNPTGRDIQIINHSDVKVDIFWIHPQTQELHKSLDAGILKSTDAVINSYINHQFEIQELPRKTTKTCRGPNNECRKAHFKVTVNDGQKFIIEKDLTVTYQDARSRALEQAKKVSEQCPLPTTTSDGSKELPDLDAWTACLQQEINATLEEPRQEIEFQAGVRKDLGRKLVTYACKDQDNFPNATSSYNTTLNLGLYKNNPKMKYLFQSETSKVALLENFVSKSQCKWLQESAKKKGGKLTWKAIDDNSIQTILSRMYKVLDYVFADNNWKTTAEFLEQQRASTKFFLEMKTSKPSKKSDQEPSSFVAEQHKAHPLLGTFMLFCDTPAKGGYLHFPKAGTHFKPATGHAVLITYRDPNQQPDEVDFEEDVFTAEHVECPVVEGSQTTLTYHIPAP